MRDGSDTAERDVKAPGRAQASCRGMSGRKPRKPCGPWMAHHGVPPERRRREGTETKSRPSQEQMVCLLSRKKVGRPSGAKPIGAARPITDLPPVAVAQILVSISVGEGDAESPFRPYGGSLLAFAPKVTKRSLRQAGVLRTSLDSGVVPGARRDGPSMARTAFAASCRSSPSTTPALGLAP